MLIFNETNHEYWLDGKKLISVTQLMKKHGLAPDYSNVDTTTLERKANYGTLVHQEIENWIKNNIPGFSVELNKFIDYIIQTKVKPLESEYKVYNDIVAGTIDLILLDGEQPISADIKNTYQLHKDSVSWQLSIYLYLLTQLGYSNYKYNDFRGQCFHFTKDKTLEVVDIVIKPEEEVEKLIESERNETEYELELFDKDFLSTLAGVEKMIAHYESKKKEFELKEQQMKDAIIKAMEENGVTKYESENLKITYTGAYQKQTLDTKALKQDQPELYKQYQKTTDVKASVKITVGE